MKFCFTKSDASLECLHVSRCLQQMGNESDTQWKGKIFMHIHCFRSAMRCHTKAFIPMPPSEDNEQCSDHTDRIQRQWKS